MYFKPLFILVTLYSFSHNNSLFSGEEKEYASSNAFYSFNQNPYPFIKDIPLPEGFTRVQTGSFGKFLRQLPLKKDRTVYLFNGHKKDNQGAQFAVVDISVGNKDLQQCADAIMRLRAEFFYAEKLFDQISFKDNNSKAYLFYPPYNTANFNKYLLRVFGMCGSASLSKQLHTVANLSDIEPGDVIIRGGFPGHAVIAVDVAVNSAREKIYLLAQSYMPAQDIHLLVNPADENLSPWYKVNNNKFIQTPEYLFYSNELKKW